MRPVLLARSFFTPSFLALALWATPSFASAEPIVASFSGNIVTLHKPDANGALIASRPTQNLDPEAECDALVRSAYPATYSSDMFVCAVGEPARFVKTYDAPGYWFLF
jgi:hypothetical protein